jgi:predicted alpha/beta hydrolase family esterase
MKRVFSIHGWEGHPESGWLPWLRNELEKKGFSVIVPAMPNTNRPKMREWVEHLTNIVGIPDEDCYFIGHSLGCIAILRYIETLKDNQKIGGAVFVAGFASNPGFDDLQSFFTKPVEWEKIKSRCKSFVAIQSDNDSLVSMNYGEMFKEKLNAELVVEHNMGHFSGDDGINALPVALDSIVKISE